MEDESIEPLEGKTTAKEMKFEPTRLSYSGAKQAASAIVSELDDVEGKTVVIVGTALLVDFTNLVAASTTLDSLLQDYGAVPGFPPKLVPAKATKRLDETKALTSLSAAAGLTQVLGLVSLFREDVDYEGHETVVDPLSFEIVLASALQGAKAATVIVPDLFVVEPEFIIADGLRGKIEKVHEAKAKAWEAVAPGIASILGLEAELEEAHQANQPDEVRRIQKELSRLRDQSDPGTERLSQIDRRLSEHERSWVQRPEGEALSKLARLLRAEAILERSDSAGGPIFLHARVVASGGHQRVSRHLFRMLFLGDGLSFHGGVVVRWAVLGRNGAFQDGGLAEGQSTSSFNEL